MTVSEYDANTSKPTRNRRAHDASAAPLGPTAKPPRNQRASTKDFNDSAAPTQEGQDSSSKQLSFGDLYILKQINFETSMFFALYNHVQLPATVLEMTLSNLTLNSNGREQSIAKTDVKYCYKDIDAERVQTSVDIDAAVKAQQLTQLHP